MTILAAGLTAAGTEMLFVLPIQAVLGNSPASVFRSIASGLLGGRAFEAGPGVIALGVAIHVLISLIAASSYVGAATGAPWLWKRPVAGGLLFGGIAYIVMTFVVIPLSAIGFHWPKSPGLWAASILVHLFGFGLPMSLTARTVHLKRLGPRGYAS